MAKTTKANLGAQDDCVRRTVMRCQTASIALDVLQTTCPTVVVNWNAIGIPKQLTAPIASMIQPLQVV